MKRRMKLAMVGATGVMAVVAGMASSGVAAAAAPSAEQSAARGSVVHGEVARAGSAVVLENGQSLNQGEKRFSPDGKYTLAFQSDSNLVFSGPNGVIWSSGQVEFATNALMRDDNNLIIRSEVFCTEWSSNTGHLATAQTGPLQLVMTDQGALQIQGSKNGQVVWENGLRKYGSVLKNGYDLKKKEVLTSTNGKYRLVFQDDSNLVFYGPSGAIWCSWPVKKAPNALMRADNNLIVRDDHRDIQWSSNTGQLATAQTGSLELVVTDQGTVQIQGSKNGQVVWENGRNK